MNGISYMKQAIRNRIVSNVLPQISSTGSPTAAACELTDDGRPTVPFQGQYFYAIHSGRRQNVHAQPENYYLDEYYFFKVTISIKCSQIQRHKFGSVVIDNGDDGLNFLADLAIISLNGYLSLAEEANELLIADHPSDQMFLTGEKPIFRDSSDPMPRTATWFGARQSDSGESRPMGLSQELRFQGLRMVRQVGQL